MEEQEEKRVAVRIHADTSQLDPRDHLALPDLIKAVKAMDELYRHQLKTGFYPPGFTKEKFEEYLTRHPKQKKALESPFTVVKAMGNSLRAIPYSEIYKDRLASIRAWLKDAARCIHHAALKKFLAHRSESFRSNDFRTTDIEWIKVACDAPLELTIGPFEDYNDTMIGIKRSFEGILGINLHAETQKIHHYQALAKKFDRHLGKRFDYTPDDTITPMIVIDEIVAGGFTHIGSRPMAYALPNDPDIQKTVGSKKVFIKNVISAKFEHIARPIAKRILSAERSSILDPELYLLIFVGHEISHDIGLREKYAFKELGHSLEESKADVLGIMFLRFLAQNHVITRENCRNAAVVHTIDLLRQLRFGIEDAHAFGALLQLEWLIENGALKILNRELAICPEKLEPAFESLGCQFIELYKNATYQRANAFIQKWGVADPNLKQLLKTLENIPVDIKPVFKV